MPRPLLLACLLACLLVFGCAAVAQRPNDAPPRSDSGESSSKSTIIDLRPPMGDEKAHPNSGVADEVLELKPYNPMKAMKAIEVGDFYYKRKNYKAAASRYREALDWKDNDAIATIKLADALEKLGSVREARAYYESYLEILPKGPSAADAKAALERLPEEPEEATRQETSILKKPEAK